MRQEIHFFCPFWLTISKTFLLTKDFYWSFKKSTFPKNMHLPKTLKIMKTNILALFRQLCRKINTTIVNVDAWVIKLTKTRIKLLFFLHMFFFKSSIIKSLLPDKKKSVCFVSDFVQQETDNKTVTSQWFGQCTKRSTQHIKTTPQRSCVNPRGRLARVLIFILSITIANLAHGFFQSDDKLNFFSNMFKTPWIQDQTQNICKPFCVILSWRHAPSSSEHAF